MKNYLKYPCALFFCLLFLTTASAQNLTICDCVTITVEMLEEAKSLGFDVEQMNSLEEKYKERMARCERLSEGKSTDERSEMERAMKDCPAYSRIEILTEEMLNKLMENIGEELDIDDNSSNDNEELIDQTLRPLSEADKTAICNCADMMRTMLEEAKSMDFDEEKMKSLETKYKSKMEICEQLEQGKSEQERLNVSDYLSKCPSYEKVEQLMSEMMEVMMKNYDEGND